MRTPFRSGWGKRGRESRKTGEGEEEGERGVDREVVETSVRLKNEGDKRVTALGVGVFLQAFVMPA
jgi:hypothetical protein